MKRMTSVLYFLLVLTSCTPDVEYVPEIAYVDSGVYIVKENNECRYTSKSSFTEALDNGSNITVIRNGRIKVEDTIYDLQEYYGIMVDYNSARFYNLQSK